MRTTALRRMLFEMSNGHCIFCGEEMVLAIAPEDPRFMGNYMQPAPIASTKVPSCKRCSISVASVTDLESLRLRLAVKRCEGAPSPWFTVEQQSWLRDRGVDVSSFIPRFAFWFEENWEPCHPIRQMLKTAIAMAAADGQGAA